jgi:hypothetical protein
VGELVTQFFDSLGRNRRAVKLEPLQLRELRQFGNGMFVNRIWR